MKDEKKHLYAPICDKSVLKFSFKKKQKKQKKQQKKTCWAERSGC